MHSIYRGKIGRLTPELREQLNLRLVNGEAGTALAVWLNSLPEVQAMLNEEFDGMPVSQQNISAWCKYGFQDWLRLRQARHLAAEIGELPAASSTKLTDQLSAWGSIRYLMAVRDLVENEPDGSAHFKTMREFHRDIIDLRRADYRSARLDLDKKQL